MVPWAYRDSLFLLAPTPQLVLTLLLAKMLRRVRVERRELLLDEPHDVERDRIAVGVELVDLRVALQLGSSDVGLLAELRQDTTPASVSSEVCELVESTPGFELAPVSSKLSD